jgi:hypothetical protein
MPTPGPVAALAPPSPPALKSAPPLELPPDDGFARFNAQAAPVPLEEPDMPPLRPQAR